MASCGVLAGENPAAERNHFLTIAGQVEGATANVPAAKTVPPINNSNNAFQATMFAPLGDR